MDTKSGRYSQSAVANLVETADAASTFFNTLIDHPCRTRATPEEVEETVAHLARLEQAIERMWSTEELTMLGTIRRAIRILRNG